MLLLFFFDEYRVSIPVPEYFWFVVYFVKYLNGYSDLYFCIIYLKMFLSFYLEIISVFDIKLFHEYSIRMDYVSISSLLLHFYWEDETINSELSMRIFFDFYYFLCGNECLSPLFGFLVWDYSSLVSYFSLNVVNFFRLKFSF